MSTSSSASASAAAVTVTALSPNDADAVDDEPVIALPFGDVNLLVLTDVHSWIAGHERHEPARNVDYGDVLSFYQALKNYVTTTNNNNTHNKNNNNGDLFLVMNGDFMDGTGLSTTPPNSLTPLLERMHAL
jgi:2',3'-cyclic-nucleotide 2'-phosphodiesterase (5'-nucleotidase family)